MGTCSASRTVRGLGEKCTPQLAALMLQVYEVAVSSHSGCVSVTWDAPSGAPQVWSISTTGSLRAHSSVREKRNRKHPAVKEPREQRGLTLRKKQGLGFGLFFLKEENAIAEWEVGSQRKENDRGVMKERTEGDSREAEEGPRVTRR